MTSDLNFSQNVWNFCTERFGKFGVAICFGFGDILGFKVGWGGRFGLPTGRGIMQWLSGQRGNAKFKCYDIEKNICFILKTDIILSVFLQCAKLIIISLYMSTVIP